MTTTPAMPELPEPFALSVSVHEGDTPAKTYVECMLYQKHPNEKQRLYTADQMRARDAMWAERLATLQAQPAAEVSSDEEINRIVYEHTKLNPNQADDVELLTHIRNAVRVILALRPQAVPMTELEIYRAAVDAGFPLKKQTPHAVTVEFDPATRAALVRLTRLVEGRGITSPAGGEG